MCPTFAVEYSKNRKNNFYSHRALLRRWVLLVKAVTSSKYLVFLAGLLNVLFAAPIYAGCSNPTGNEKDIVYNDDYHTYQFCDGTQWISMGKPIAGGRAGAGPGYFIMTKTVYNGNFNSTEDNLNAPDATCLTELTTATGWKGYSEAKAKNQLIASKVHAFLCTERICNKLIPLTSYYFGNAADVTITAGGASFTTDANGDGPNDLADWSALAYFNGDYIYWTGYRRPATDSSWGDTPTGGGYQCQTTNPWDTGINSAKGVYGHSTFTGKERWWAGNDTCDHSHYLICYIDP
jgi:hypothetical protein